LALDLLRDDNLDDKVFATQAAVGQDYIEAIALDSVRRGGAQGILKRLKKLPYITSNFAKRVAQLQLGGSWEHYTEEDRTQKEVKVEPPPRKPKSK
jgi:hypothetical protein